MKWTTGFLLCLVATSARCQGVNSLLWKITGNNLKKPSYLFGTIHAIPKDKFFIPQNLISSFLSSEVIVLETGLNRNMSDSSMKKEITMPIGHTLKDLYAPKDFEYLQRYFIDTLKGTAANLNCIKPIWILSVISGRWYPNYVAYEPMFINKAQENKKSVVGLEETSEQAEMFNRIPLKEQAAILLNSLKNRESEYINYNILLKLYVEQNVDLLSSELHSQLKEYPNFENAIFYERNNAWALKIDAMIKEKICFIAVGAGHLAGKDGLIVKLRKLGYQVEPL